MNWFGTKLGSGPDLGSGTGAGSAGGVGRYLNLKRPLDNAPIQSVRGRQRRAERRESWDSAILKGGDLISRLFVQRSRS